MPTKNIIRVSEFEKLYYDDKQAFKKKHWDALCNYLESANKKEEKRVEYFRILNKGIQFTNYVGVIQAANLTIEILPKVDRDNTTAANETVDSLDNETAVEKQKWQGVLLQMLKECRLLKVNHVDYANLNLRGHSILDLYIELFLEEAEQLLHEGLAKKYQKKQGNQTALKGQLLFSQQIAHNIIHQERFYISYTEYNRNNIFNQILFKTIQLIPNICNNNYLLDKVGRLQQDFPEVSLCSVTAETFDKLRFDRKTERYKEAMLISKMLLLNYRPDITGGSENVIAILFDMNKLWEEFVYRRLKKEEGRNEIDKVDRQQTKNFWKSDLLGRHKTIRPDIVITTTDKKRIVVDTKWKVLGDLIPSDDDLKQMFVYNLYWECDKSVLLYPSSKNDDSIGYYKSFKKPDEEVNKCHVVVVGILKEGSKQIDDAFGSTVLEYCLAPKLELML